MKIINEILVSINNKEDIKICGKRIRLLRKLTVAEAANYKSIGFEL